MATTGDSHGDAPGATAGRWLVVAAAVLWSMNGLFAKATVFESWSESQRGGLLAFWRALFATAILVFLVRRREWSRRMIPMAISFAVMNLVFLNAMSMGEATLAIWLQYTAPIWVFLAEVYWLGQRPRRGDRMMLVLAGGGLAVILGFELPGASPAAVVYGLLSGLFFAAVVLSLRSLKRMDPAWLVTVNHAVTALVFSPLVIYHGVWPSGVQWLFLAGFGMLQMGLPYALFARGLRRISGREASMLTLLEPLLVPVWVWLAWGGAAGYQPPSAATLIGGACILAGLAARQLLVEHDDGQTLEQ